MTISFWAKTTPDGQPGISVLEHMVHAGRVAQCLAERLSILAVRFGLTAETIGALAGLHDLGKISPGFQRKCKAWLTENKLLDIARNGVWDTRMEPDHGKVTHMAVQKFLTASNVKRSAAKLISAALGGHHGRLSKPDERGYRPQGEVTEERSGIGWEQERFKAAQAVCQLFGPDLQNLNLDTVSPRLWWLAGLITVADWIGSDETYFPTGGGAAIGDPFDSAKKAVEGIDFSIPEIIPNLDFQDLFGFLPNDMQTKALSEISGPGIYVIEAPMGMGKTEAALGVAYRLLASGKARGIYFALPTQATSNRIHLRMGEFIRRISKKPLETRLIHGNSWLLQKADKISIPLYTGDDINDDIQIGRDWFASTKRALLAPFGVGTVDQALLGVVAAKHFFVRHFALAGKVVILDEVHSYDLYTGTLIDNLIRTLEELGCTVIVLSATLSGKRREKIVSFNADTSDAANSPYPLILTKPENSSPVAIAAAPPAARELNITFSGKQEAVSQAVEIARKGGCVLWICNTVDAAQQQYRSFQDIAGTAFPTGLLHSRFPFWRREQLESEWMERFGKAGKTRCGSILVATQIVEQSVDLDADLLVTELAPTDMLLQRTGRLWRHSRSNRPVSEPRLIILRETACLDEFRHMNKNEIRKTLGDKAWVYDPYVLLRTLEVWHGLERIEIPSHIRTLIERTYEDRDTEPESWQQLFEDGWGKSLAYRQKALQSGNIWTLPLDDEEGVQTRINEVPTLSLVLCKSLTRKTAALLDGANVTLGGRTFSLESAQAIHRNIVKIPQYHFTPVSEDQVFSRYLRGSQRIGIVCDDGSISADGLKQGLHLRWSTGNGVTVDKQQNKEEQ